MTQHTDCVKRLLTAEKCHKFTRYKRHCEFIHAHKKYHLTNSQEQYFQIRCNEFHENLLIRVQHEDGNLSTAVVK
jgi:hypothetical protein